VPGCSQGLSASGYFSVIVAVSFDAHPVDLFENNSKKMAPPLLRAALNYSRKESPLPPRKLTVKEKFAGKNPAEDVLGNLSDSDILSDLPKWKK
jgi:hypothetical protein